MTKTTKEDWGKRGNVEVTRDDRGRFVSWSKVVAVYSHPRFREKAIAVYGQAITRFGADTRRYEFYGGTMQELTRAVKFAYHNPPRNRFVSVYTRDFLNDPYGFSTFGEWVTFDVDS